MVEELPGKTRFSPQLKTLRVDDELVVSRGQRVGEPSGVLTVSTPANDSSTVALAQLDSAYSLRNELDASWAARPMGLVHARERLPLVMEDPGGPLLDGLVGDPPDVEEFLRLVIGPAFALGVLHKRGLIHKGTKPANILADLATRQVWLNGLGFCSRTPRESHAPNSPEAIAGTLVYMASDHGDRMNPSVNSRAELYSCSVTLYEVLTGRFELRPLGGYQLVLVVSDDGVGLPLNLHRARVVSWSLQLVHDLTDQLHGSEEASWDSGTTFTVTFDEADSGEVEA